jgi:hypothetical protein
MKIVEYVCIFRVKPNYQLKLKVQECECPNYLFDLKSSYVKYPMLNGNLDIVWLIGQQFEQGIEQHTLKNINHCLNINIYSYLETSGDQSSNPYLNVHFFNTIID